MYVRLQLQQQQRERNFLSQLVSYSLAFQELLVCYVGSCSIPRAPRVFLALPGLLAALLIGRGQCAASHMHVETCCCRSFQ